MQTYFPEKTTLLLEKKCHFPEDISQALKFANSTSIQKMMKSKFSKLVCILIKECVFHKDTYAKNSARVHQYISSTSKSQMQFQVDLLKEYC